MILLVDNYDSFTYNLVHLFQELGADVVVRRNDEIDGREAEALHPSHLVVSPGPGDPESAGRALLTTLEELNSFISAEQITNLYFEADRRLGEDLSYQTMKRLRECARLLTAHPVSAVAAGASTTILFEEEVKQCESNLIKQALDQANGSVTRAARILGLTHQGLCYIINHRHKNLLASRAPIRVRRKSVIRK